MPNDNTGFDLDTTDAPVGEKEETTTTEGSPAEPAQKEEVSARTEVEEADKETEENNLRRDAARKLSDMATILLESPDKEAALTAIKSNATLYNDLKRRFPEKVAALEGKEERKTDNAFEKIASNVASAIEVERMVTAQMLKKEAGLADDEYAEIKSFADALLVAQPTLSYDKALNTAISVIAPEKTAHTKKGIATPRGEGKTADALAEYKEQGMSKGEAELAAHIQSKGGKVEKNEFGILSVSL